MMRTIKIALAAVMLAAGLAYLAGCGGALVAPPRPAGPQVAVYPASSQTLGPCELAYPDTPRWMDVADQVYSDAFKADFAYGTQVAVTYEDSAATLAGALTATALKPWCAYQIKLIGTQGILGTDEASNVSDPQAWSSYQLGTVGRWWCEECGWNLSDAEVQQHLDQGHTVVGYLLFDWFVTDASGNATHSFALDDSFHVLWKTSQRRPRRNDSARVNYHVVRDTYAYPPAAVGSWDNVAIYAEWERGRPKPGDVALAPGQYEVEMNLTEETFHNVPPYLASEFPWGHTNYADGGFWAKVLSGYLAFDVTGGGEPPSATGAIAGKVTAGSGRGIAGATVTVVETSDSAVTNRTGRYTIGDLPEGSYSMTAYHGELGSDQASGVVVVAGSTTKQAFDLQ